MSLELVPNCPACGCSRKQVVYSAVPDFVFQASSELWQFVACHDCSSLYLPHRPDVDSIGFYYNKYYTHDSSASEVNSISGIAIQSSGLKRLANSWRNRRHGLSRSSFGLLGAVVIEVVRPLRHWLDAECRHIPARTNRPGDFRVLDIGFGDGRFLEFANEAGAQPVGMEIDHKAFEIASARGLDVYKGDIKTALKLFGEDSFEYITMSHVIEHVHSPREVMTSAARLLRPGGTLWIETPNPRSFGHMVFGARWRDLDPPRHLCIMTERALNEMAEACGFRRSESHFRPFSAFEVFPFSARAGASKLWKNRFMLVLLCLAAEALSFFRPRYREWLTLSYIRSK